MAKKTQKLTLILGHFYPEKMNIYGDWGNILTLKKRCEWRGIKFEYKAINDAAAFNFSSCDLFFFGGGQDKDQLNVFRNLLQARKTLLDLVLKDKPFLLVCGGFQLFGKIFIDAQGNPIKGLDILDMETRALSPEVKQRCIGNLLAETDLPIEPRTLVGFENHGGQTHLGPGMKPLAKVLSGFGNNFTSGYEGGRFHNVFGCYLHGSLLPKNPQLADYLIKLALEHKYGQEILLDKLDDSWELKAHQVFLHKYSV